MNTLAIHKRLLFMFFLETAFLFCFSFSFAQSVLPQRSIKIPATQPINFGSFCVTGGEGGTITVLTDGSRTSTGNIILLPMAPIAQPAIFEIKLCQGRNVSIKFDTPIINLDCSGGFLSLKIGPTDKGGDGARFITNSDCNIITPLTVGGTLTVPGTAFPGIYSGIFSITLIQQ